MYGGQPNTAAGCSESIGGYSIVVPSYDVVDLFMNCYPTDKINLRPPFDLRLRCLDHRQPLRATLQLLGARAILQFNRSTPLTKKC